MDFEKLKNRTIKELQLRAIEQRSDGAFLAGHNGPYKDPETPIRNTAHMLYSLCSAYELSGDLIFKKSAEKAVNYILDNEYICPKGNYIFRLSKNKDSSNGVIGHAWLIEALLKASNLFDRQLIDEAKKIWKLHRFDYQLGAWEKPVEDSKVDQTFNHQLWFAACISPIEDDEIRKQISCFIRKNVTTLTLYKNGVIFHDSSIGSLYEWAKRDPLLAIRRILKPIRRPRYKMNKYLHSAGYHTFNLYAFAMLFESGYEAILRKNVNVSMLLSSLVDMKLADKLNEVTDIGLRYNPSGIEAAYALKVLSNKPCDYEISQWLSLQLEYTESREGLLVRESPDSATSSARLYEAFRLFDQL
jgi:hypothetical protein